MISPCHARRGVVADVVAAGRLEDLAPCAVMPHVDERRRQAEVAASQAAGRQLVVEVRATAVPAVAGERDDLPDGNLVADLDAHRTRYRVPQRGMLAEPVIDDDAIATVMDRFRRMIEQELQLIELRAEKESE